MAVKSTLKAPAYVELKVEDPELQKYVHNTSRDPQNLYEFVSENPKIVSKENLAILQQLVGQAVEEWADAKAKEKEDEKLHFSQGRFFFFKFVVLKFCLEAGIEKFFDSLCSDPPDSLVMQFQKALIMFSQDPQAYYQQMDKY